MSGWDSLETVTRLHGSAQIVGLILIVLAVALVAFAAYQLRNGVWPQWLDIGEYQVRSRFFEIACAVVLALLLTVEIAALSFGRRQDTLMAAAERASGERIKRLVADAQARETRESQNRETQGRAAPEPANRYLKENSELRQKLIDAENKVAALEKAQMQKRLSEDQKRFLVEALRPFAGQKVSIASIRGDDESLALAQDFVSVFETAGWDHHGENGVTAQDWPRDPVGIEVTLNEKDARANEIPPGVAALINVTRQLGLVYGSTIYMDGEVPSGQALLKVGKKLKK